MKKTARNVEHAKLERRGDKRAERIVEDIRAEGMEMGTELVRFGSHEIALIQSERGGGMAGLLLI